MRISRFRAFTLAGLLGLALAGASSAASANKVCPEDPDEPKAWRLAECDGGFTDRGRLAQIYQRRLGLAAGAAARLADALASLKALDARRGESGPAFEQEIRRTESEFVSLLEQAPDDPETAVDVSWFYGREVWYSRVPSPALLDLVAHGANPVRLASRLTERGFSKADVEILFAALAVRPESVQLWHRASQRIYNLPWRIALLEEACRRAAGETGHPIDAAAATTLAEELLVSELDAGLAPQALATFQSLAPALRAPIEKGSERKIAAQIDGLPFEGRSRDLRRSLVAAYLLAGDREAAARLLAKIKPFAYASPLAAKFDIRVGETERRLLALWLTPSLDDPFDLLTTRLSGSETVEGSGTGALAFARLAERERYPAIAAYALSLLVRERDEPAPEPVRGVLARVRAAAEALRGEIETLDQSLADEARADREAARIASGPDPAAATVSRLLSAPAEIRFAEKPLPEGIVPVELSHDQSEVRRKAMAAEASDDKLPTGFGLIRIERQGERVAALGVSQDYDPVGEVSSGAYWIRLSSDGGRTWEPPLYTGLRVNEPYVVRAVSNLPLLAEGHLQVEVEIAELDPSTIYFPPIALAPRRTQKGLYLDIPLDLLRLDSDGDGLTDLAEERLVTDPRSRDTDGDGLADGVDPMPTVPLQPGALSSSALALTALLASNWNVSQGAIVEGIPDQPGIVCCVKDGVRSVNEKTLFMIGDRALFSALKPPGRLVVLTAEEAEAAKQKFGPFYPQRLDLFVFDRSGRRAYVVWSASWQGGQTLLEEEADGTWTASTTSSWVT
jgi:hypothetical protein